jgi:hypothetical protein
MTGIDVQELSAGLRDLMTLELSGPGRTPLEAQKFMPKGLLPPWLAALLDWICCVLRRLRAA